MESSIVHSQTKKGMVLEKTGAQLDQIAYLMDQCFRIPGINWRFGVESLIGLVPGAGDLVGGAIGLLVLFRAFQFKLPKIVILRMITNTLLDITVGSIPFLGDAFDFFWKSNTRNMKLFHHYAEEPQKSTRAHWIFLGSLVGGFLLLFGLIVYGFVLLLWQLFKH